MKQYYSLFLLLLLGSSCASSSEDKFIHLDVRSMLEGIITIKNVSEEPIIINTFAWEYAALSIEVKTMDEGDTILLSSPPTPPIDLERYDIELKSQAKVTIPLKGLEVLKEHQESLQLRSTGYYELKKSKERRRVVSDWVHREALQ